MSRVIDQTERLTLRELSDADADFILRLLNEPTFLEFIGDKQVRTLDDAKAYMRDGPMASYAEHGFGLYLVERTEDSTRVGICGLLKRDTLDHADIGFALLPEFWSRGYAVESGLAVMGLARDTHSLERVVAITTQNNAASQTVLERIGMSFEKLIRLSEDGEEICLFGRNWIL